MTGGDRLLCLGLLVAAVCLFVSAAGSRSDTLRVLGYFLAGALAWGGVLYAYGAIMVASGTMHP